MPSSITLTSGSSSNIVIPLVSCNTVNIRFSLTSALQYSYSTTAGNVVTNATGTIAGISSASTTISPTLPAFLTTTFTESGLPSGYTWNLTYNGNYHSNTTTTSVFVTGSGTFSYTTYKLSNSSSGCTTTYTPSASGTLTAGSSEIITYVASTSCVTTFTESRLPSGTKWWIDYDNINQSSTSASISFSTSSSTFSYSIGQLTTRTNSGCYLQTVMTPLVSSGSAKSGSSINIPFQISTGCTFTYVVNDGSDTVSVINTTSNAVIGTIDVGSDPYGISMSTVDST